MGLPRLTPNGSSLSPSAVGLELFSYFREKTSWPNLVDEAVRGEIKIHATPGGENVLGDTSDKYGRSVSVAPFCGKAYNENPLRLLWITYG